MRYKIIFCCLCLLICAPAASAGWWPFGESAAPPAATPRKPPAPTNIVGQIAPVQALPFLADPVQSQAPSAWRGQLVLVNFFASWCLRCREEHPLFETIKQQTGVMLVGIAHMDRPDDTKNFLARHGNPYGQVLTDLSGAGGKGWGVRGLPASFLLDAEGKIIWQHNGALTAALLQTEILPLLPKGKP